MPKLGGPLFSLEAHKALAKALTFQRRPGGAAVYGYKKPKVPLTFAQYLQRYKIRLSVLAWQALSDAAKAEWEVKAQGQGQSGYSYFIKKTVWLPIDVGTGADNYDNRHTANWTIIDKANPADLSGIITSVDLYFYTPAVNARVGIFRLVEGTTFICVVSAALGAVAANSKQTFPVSLPIEAGDLIGYYEQTGRLDRNDTGGSGMWYAVGEYIDPGDSTVFSSAGNYKTALYGQGIGIG